MRLTMMALLLLATTAAAQPRLLWRAPTAWGEVRVVEEGKARRLLFWSDAGETLESEMSVEAPSRLVLRYTQQMMAAVALWECRGSSLLTSPRFLLVGLGGGSLSKAVARQFPSAQVTTVELEPVVVEAARRWFAYEETSRVVTVVDDARHFLEVDPGLYDVIMLDAFDEGGAPDQLRTVEFFSLVKRHLRPGGLVISNVHYDPWLPARRYLRSADEVFGSSYVVESPLNGAAVFSREPVSALPVWEGRDEYAKSYGLPVMELLSPRMGVDLEKIAPYRDSDPD